ncbi:serine--tRNA ligase, partial [Micromonospora sp. NPDC003776]
VGRAVGVHVVAQDEAPVDAAQPGGGLGEPVHLRSTMSELPNLPADDVVAGGKEANRVVRTFGEPPAIAQVRDHVELSRALGLVDHERGVKLGGSGFWMYTGMGARLEWALVNWLIEQNIQAGYEFLLPPHLLLDSAGFAAGQFPKFHDDVYHIDKQSSARGQFLLPTAETAILGAFQDEILETGKLPLKAFAYTPCYRREAAGSHSDERGTVRGHQFNKVEIFQFTLPEQADAALESMVGHVEGLVGKLGLHFQTSLLAAGDASASMRKTLDVEVWMPSTGKYKEVSSVSWGGDYQARRAAIRYREPGGKQTRFVHTLNGSALATSRLFPAILEQFQQADGSVLVPEVLRDKLGADRLTPIR